VPSASDYTVVFDHSSTMTRIVIACIRPEILQDISNFKIPSPC